MQKNEKFLLIPVFRESRRDINWQTSSFCNIPVAAVCLRLLFNVLHFDLTVWIYIHLPADAVHKRLILSLVSY